MKPRRLAGFVHTATRRQTLWPAPFRRRPWPQVLLCNEHRPALPFPWELFEASGFSVQQVPPEQQHPDWRSDDILLFRIRLAASQ